MVQQNNVITVADQIIQVLKFLAEQLGIAVDWTSETVMPKVEEICTKFIQWEVNTSIFWIAFTVGLTLLCWIITIPLVRWAKREGWCEDFSHIMGVGACVVSAFVSIAAVITVGVQIYDIIECYTFPEKVLYDYITYQLSLMN